MSTDANLRVLLVANYVADGQPSMQRFANALHEELATRGVEVETWRPSAIVGGQSMARGGLHKWLGYADKYLLSPPRLRKAVRDRARPATVVHVCDHSNAVYVPWIRHLPHVVTCHDLLAAHAPHSRSGRSAPAAAARSAARPTAKVTHMRQIR